MNEGIRRGAAPSNFGLAQPPLLIARDAGDKEVRQLYRERPLRQIYEELCARNYPREAVGEAIAAQARARGAQAPALWENIDRLRDPRTCAIVTGQQVGIFGGPVYSLYKALSAVRLAWSASRRGISAVPIFWLASYDHDFREVSHVTVVNGKAKPAYLQLDHPPGRAPVGALRLGPEIKQLVEHFGQELHATQAPFANEALKLLREIYTPDETFAGAFARLLGSLTDRYGLLILDPSVREVAAHGRELFTRELLGSPSSYPALAVADAELSRLGFRARIVSRPEDYNVFWINDRGDRVRLRRGPHRNWIADGIPLGINKQELEALLLNSPERFSPSALLRPVLESTLLPTLTYVAGPAESAYYAQIAGVYDWAQVPFPHVASRASLALIRHSEYSHFAQATGRTVNTIVGAKQPRRALAWISLPDEVADAYRCLEMIVLSLDAPEIDACSLSRQVDSALRRAQDTVSVAGLERCLRGLAYSIPRIENWLRDFKLRPDSAIRRIRRELSRLIEQALKVGRHLNPIGITTIHHLLPQNDPQERKLSIAQLLAEFGPQIAEALLPFAEPNQTARQLLVLPEHAPIIFSATSPFSILALDRSRAELVDLQRTIEARFRPPVVRSSQPRRIGVLALSGLGGSGSVARTCAQGYAAAGNSCTLFSSPESVWPEDIRHLTFPPENLPPGDSQKVPPRHPVRIIAVSAPNVPIEPESYWVDTLAQELAASIARDAIEVLHVHYVAGLIEAAVAAVDILKRKNLKIIATFHGTDVTRFGQDERHRLRIADALKCCAGLTAVSEALAEQAYSVFGLPQIPRVIGNSIDPKIWNPDRWSNLRSQISTDGELVLCHVSNLRPVKRSLDAVRLLSQLRERGLPAKLMLIGDGPEIGKLYQLAEELRVVEAILPFGEQSPERLPMLVAASDLLIVTSESEGFSLAALEAMACGVPVVSTRCGGLEEIFQKLELDPVIRDGLLAPIGDINRLTENCLSLVRNEKVYREIQRAAIRLPIEIYPRHLQLQSYLQLVEEVCQP
jgi:bacillithiol biosynthesis cysteine-adding enzyme BshC/N-acetyl-alpha-D-glucosaminyl L-malate synthase BshA